jgi:predicted MPP superfamily phosphohydrolase
MLFFLLFYFGIYGSMHIYFFFKCHQACGPEGWRLLLLIVFLLLMLNGPILVRVLERQGAVLPATVLAWISYLWMAALLWFIFLGLIRDLWNTVIRSAALAAPSSYGLIIPARPAFLAILLIIAVATVWGFMEARGLRTEKITITTDLLPPDISAIKVAQISDVHLGLIEGDRRIRQILDILYNERPDIFVSTGDLLDGLVPHVNNLSLPFTAYNPPLGKFAVTGNHEFYAGLPGSLRFLEEAGFQVLRGTSVDVGPIRIAGVDDPTGFHTGDASYMDENAALSMGKGERFTILMKHQPLVKESSLGKFQLQMSGHTHKGQIFPFNYPVRLRYRYIAGLFDLAKDSRIYTSRGTGTWGPPLRLLSPAEVTIFKITRVDS